LRFSKQDYSQRLRLTMDNLAPALLHATRLGVGFQMLLKMIVTEHVDDVVQSICLWGYRSS